MMDIAALSIGMSQAKLGQAVGISLLRMVKEQSVQNSAEFITKMMQQSVQPHLGKHIDVRV
jgi:hypothetical protein